jgi:hypothetical protein
MTSRTTSASPALRPGPSEGGDGGTLWHQASVLRYSLTATEMR